MKTCENHPNRNAYSICHNCRKSYCEECLNEGKEYYYCKNPECQEVLRKELPAEVISSEVIACPNCDNDLEISEEERISGMVHCPECEVLIDFNTDPPKVFHKENYVELFSSLNQGDISIIKSILENANIDYYVFGENFLGAEPLIQPARFFVNENNLEEAKELLKDYDFRIWGYSSNQY
ncbi:MAG: DUF2007 domain-containing protein [Ignavibacteriales bacterium]|nr:MAG: DUF2007 domain-containing protein [Ignavibacteriales bacterium]